MLPRLRTWWTLGIDPRQSLTAETSQRIERLGHRWHEVMAVVNAQPRQRRLNSLPWYLVIGPEGAGKSSLLSHSGLGLDAVVSNDPAASCDAFTLWFNDQAVFVEVAGRLLSGGFGPDWNVLLHLITRTRGHLPLRGVVMVKPLPEQFRHTSSETAADATLVRDRLQALNDRTGTVVPMYVVISKTDLLGGFKEFFAQYSRQDRERVLGMTTTWPPERDPVREVTVEYERLLDSLRDRRLNALATTTTAAAQRKLLQFPGQLRAAMPFLTDWLAIAARPMQDRDPTLRGVYVTSSLVPIRNPTAPPVVRPQNEEPPKSMFFAVPSKAPASATASTATTPTTDTTPPEERGATAFVAGVFTRVLRADVALARQTVAAQRRSRRARMVCLGVLPSLAAWCLLAIGWSTWHGVRLVENLRSPHAALGVIQRSTPGDATAHLIAIDQFGSVLHAALQHHGKRLGPAGDAAAQQYVRALHPLLIDTCMRSIHDELAALRRGSANATVTQGGMADLLRAYQMLGGMLMPQPELISRALLDERRWFRGVDPVGGGACEFRIEALARQQLDLCVGTLLPAGLLRLDIDRTLVTDLHRELGDRLLIEQAYTDLVHRLESGFSVVAPDSLLTNPMQSALSANVMISRFYTQESWDRAIASAVDEQADVVVADLAAQDLPYDRATIIGRLRQRFVDDHQQHWLAAIASMKAAQVRDFRDTAAQLDRLCAEDSPLPRFIASVLDHLALSVANTATRGKTDSTWIRPCIQTLATLRGDVLDYQQAMALAKRTTDPDRLRVLIGRFNAVSERIAGQLSHLEPAATRTAIRAGFDSLLRSLIADLDQATITDLDRLWSEQVSQVFNAHLAKRFPFARDGSDDVPMSEFIAFFNPNGTLWTVLTQIETVRDINILGKPMMTPGEEYLRMLRRAQGIRALFFAGSSQTMNLRFGYRMQQREHVRDLKVQFGATINTLYERPDARYQAEISQGGAFGAKVSLQTVSGEWKHSEHAGDWGFLHLLRAGQPTSMPSGELVCTWEHDMPISGKNQAVRATVVLEAGMADAVAGELLSGMTLPRRVFGADGR